MSHESAVLYDGDGGGAHHDSSWESDDDSDFVSDVEVAEVVVSPQSTAVSVIHCHVPSLRWMSCCAVPLTTSTPLFMQPYRDYVYSIVQNERYLDVDMLWMRCTPPRQRRVIDVLSNAVTSDITVYESLLSHASLSNDYCVFHDIMMAMVTCAQRHGLSFNTVDVLQSFLKQIIWRDDGDAIILNLYILTLSGPRAIRDAFVPFLPKFDSIDNDDDNHSCLIAYAYHDINALRDIIITNGINDEHHAALCRLAAQAGDVEMFKMLADRGPYDVPVCYTMYLDVITIGFYINVLTQGSSRWMFSNSQGFG